MFPGVEDAAFIRALGKVRVYDSATYADTDYTYSATTGKLTQRDFPEESSQHIRTSYSYDTRDVFPVAGSLLHAGRSSSENCASSVVEREMRIQYETVTREAAGSTNLSRTTYTQSYSTGGHYSQQIRTEETGSGASWINSSRTTYRYDGMNRQDYEKREDYLSDPDPAFVQTYLIEQEYDKLYPTRGSQLPHRGVPHELPTRPCIHQRVVIARSDVVPAVTSLGWEQSGDRVRFMPQA